MCHTSCDLEEAGKLTDYLGTIKTWMDKNQGQVVTVLLTNGDRVDVNMFKNDFETSGMASYAYAPPKKLAMNEWPTLQTLINDGKRAVIFLGIFIPFYIQFNQKLISPDYLADSNKAPYILDEFSYYFETAFDVTEFTDCALNRPPGSDGNGLMMLGTFRIFYIFGALLTITVNHFKDIELLPDILIPDVVNTPKTNAATGEDSIGEHSDWCVSEWGGRGPNMVLVDNFNIGKLPFRQLYWNCTDLKLGNVFQAERTLNHL